jgi:acetylornithine/N-succinyldiaminopimelate aminotransferase
MSQDLSELSSHEEHDFFKTYKRLPVVIDRGEGCYLYTYKGEKILDMFGGLAVNVLGYNYPGINEAVNSQLKRYIHISNYFYQEKQIELAGKILKLSGFSKLFFSNSGTESTEAAIKLIRKFFLGTNKKTLISFSGSFHGRTMGALSLTARKKYRDQFAPLLPDIQHLEFNSLSDLEKSINDSTAGVFIECIQGEGGVNPVSQGFVDKLNELKIKFGFIIAADEIQTGVGRTGKLHSFEHYGLDADIVILAKGIGGGLPLGAIIGSERVENVFTLGEHGSTFGGNPVAAACGTVIFSMLEEGLMDKVKELGKYLVSKAESLKRDYPGMIKDVRGKGLMVGIELNSPGEFAVKAMMDKGVLINCTNENVIRLLPPYVITKNDIDYFIGRFEEVIKSVK